MRATSSASSHSSGGDFTSVRFAFDSIRPEFCHPVATLPATYPLQAVVGPQPLSPRDRDRLIRPYPEFPRDR